MFKHPIVLISKLTEQKKSHTDILDKLTKNDILIENIIHVPCDSLDRQNQYIFEMIKAHRQNDIMSKYTTFDSYCEYILLFSDVLFTELVAHQKTKKNKNSSLINSIFIKFPAYVFSAWVFWIINKFHIIPMTSRHKKIENFMIGVMMISSIEQISNECSVQ